MKQYKAIFLDWDDTIGDFRHAAEKSLSDIYDYFHVNECFPTQEAFAQCYNIHNLELWAKYGLGEVTKEYLEFDRFFYPIMKAPKPWPVDKCISQAVLMGKVHLEHTTRYFSLLPNAERVIKRLATIYPLTIVSNGFVEVQYKKIERSGLGEYFQYVILSEEVGIQKPQRGIFDIALQRNGLQADEVLMIGDSWNSDIQGAINAGIDQVWIQDPRHTTDPNLPATYKVERIADVLTLLGVED